MTDRSGDRSDQARLPNLVIAGVGKAGTTSLFWYLSQHPQICASSVKEPRYFRLPDEPDATQPPLEDYARHFAHCGDQRYVMEASPQYFKGRMRTIRTIQQTLPDPRVILMFRDPVAKLWSEYRFKRSHMTIPNDVDFDAFIERCERVRDEGRPRVGEDADYYTLAGGTYAEIVGEWLDAFGNAIHVGFFEDMVADPASFVGGVCRWLGIDDAVASTFTYSVENRTEGYRSGALQRVAIAANREGGALRNRRRLKAPLRKLYYSINRSRAPEAMSSDARARLSAWFAPSNEALGAILRARGYERLPSWCG
ncbi:MAG: sulfotransferase family protein [Actinomycetota bacterium]